MEMQKERPPYVEFEVRAVKDEAASVEAGRAVYTDVDFALIMPIGGKDRVEREASSWLESVSRQVAEDRLPQAWETHFKAIYKAWKEGQEIPINGLSVKMWPIATPAQVKTLIDMKIMTVEDLAVATEQAITRLGIGARELKQKAQAYLRSADRGQTTEQLAAQEQKIEAMALRIEALERENKELLALQQKKAA